MKNKNYYPDGFKFFSGREIAGQEFKSLRKKAGLIVADTVSDQIAELFEIVSPGSFSGRKPLPEDRTAFRKKITDGVRLENWGGWAFFPWHNTLVHFLPEKYHTILRTARNRNLVTDAEQKRYYESHIGIAGLSVGNNCLASVVYGGGGKYLRLADADTLSGSNINRIRTGFADIGLPKTELAAREVLEVNPYSEMQIFSRGLTKELIPDFLTKPRKLDVMVEETDNLYLKIQIRIAARKTRIPVVMATDNGNGIMLDVERYDLKPDYPFFHGVIPEEELLKISPEMTKAEIAGFAVRLVGEKNVPGRMKASLTELGKTLFSWPQLGTAATLAGAAAATAVRRIITGDTGIKGRTYLSLE